MDEAIDLNKTQIKQDMNLESIGIVSKMMNVLTLQSP